VAIIVEEPGAQTTVQDLGRAGLRSAGVPLGGGADSLALATANMLVGNSDGDAALQCMLSGPKIRFESDTLVAVCGARADGVPHWTAFHVPAGEVLSLSKLSEGVYAYLAIAGGIDVPVVLGSRGTDIRVGWGGFEGRALRAGDTLKIGTPPCRGSTAGRRVNGAWRVDYEPWYPKASPIRIVKGPEWNEFDPMWTAGVYRVTPNSDAMGVRLAGAALKRNREGDMQSAPVIPGTIQVPRDGQPIVMLANAQTLGGYPRLANVISADLHRVAQSAPGTDLRFAEISLRDAHELRCRRAAELEHLRCGIAAHIGRT
jgi:antagonist of KipI